MIPAEIRIKFENLLEEAKHHFNGGGAKKSQELLAEAQVMAMTERRLAELREEGAA